MFMLMIVREALVMISCDRQLHQTRRCNIFGRLDCCRQFSWPPPRLQLECRACDGLFDLRRTNVRCLRVRRAVIED